MKIATAWKSEVAIAAAIYTATNFLGALVPLMLLPILTKVLNPHDYGIVALFGVSVSVVSVIIGLSVQGSVAIQFYKLDEREFARYITACLLILVISAICVATIAYLFGANVEAITGTPRTLLLIACLVSTLQFVTNIRLSIWQYEQSPYKYAAIQLSLALLTAGLTLWFVVRLGFGWAGSILGISVAASIIATFSMWTLLKRGQIAIRTRRKYIQAALRFGVPLLPHVFGGMCLYSADLIMVAHLLGTAKAGMFSVALSAASAIQFLSIASSRAFAPWLYKHLPTMNREGRIKLVRSIYLYFFSIAAVAVIYGLVAPDLLRMLVRREFVIDRMVILYVSTGFAFAGMYFAVANFVFQKGATAKIAVVTSTCGVVNVILTYIFIKHLGLSGAGIGFMISQAIFFVATWRLSHHVNPMPWWIAIERRTARQVGNG